MLSGPAGLSSGAAILSLGHLGDFGQKIDTLRRAASTVSPQSHRGRMTAPLQRGSIVLHRGRYGVVWLVLDAGLVLHPIAKPPRRRDAHDVTMSFAELLGANVALPEAVIRCGQPVEVDASEQEHVGQIAGTLLCRVVMAAIRAHSDAVTAERWACERRHRHEAQSARPVKMVG